MQSDEARYGTTDYLYCLVAQEELQQQLQHLVISQTSSYFASAYVVLVSMMKADRYLDAMICLPYIGPYLVQWAGLFQNLWLCL